MCIHGPSTANSTNTSMYPSHVQRARQRGPTGWGLLGAQQTLLVDLARGYLRHACRQSRIAACVSTKLAHIHGQKLGQRRRKNTWKKPCHDSMSHHINTENLCHFETVKFGGLSSQISCILVSPLACVICRAHRLFQIHDDHKSDNDNDNTQCRWNNMCHASGPANMSDGVVTLEKSSEIWLSVERCWLREPSR